MDTYYSASCPSRTVVDVLANKWVLYVLSVLRNAEQPVRFNELRRAIDGVTQKSLTSALRTLERDGLVDRRVYATVPPRVEYRLTELGREAGWLLTAVNDWAKENASKIEAAREKFNAAPSTEAAIATAWTRRD